MLPARGLIVDRTHAGFKTAMTQPLLVSVVIATYNQASFLSEAVSSALGQTLPPHEVIVVDDGSTDETASILRGFGDRLKVIGQRNAGPAAARNAGIRTSTGDLVAILDSDDVWLPEKLEREVPLFARSDEIGLVHSGLVEIDEAGTHHATRIVGLRGQIAADMLLMRDALFPGGSRMLISRRALDDVGLFDDRLPPVEDWDMCFRISRRFRVEFVAEPLTLYRAHATNIHRNVSKLEQSLSLAFEKAFSDPDPSIQRLRRRAYAKFHMVLSGSYLHAGAPGPAIKHMLVSIRLDPRQASYIFRLPVRRLRRWGVVKTVLP